MRVKIIETKEYLKLKILIGEFGRKRIARRTGLTYSALNQKLNGFIPFTKIELSKITKYFPGYEGE